MYFAPSEKSKAVLNEWHQTCVEAGSNNQPAWNKVFNQGRRNSMDYHVMTKELYPHGYLLEQRGFLANDQQVCPLPQPTDHPHLLLSSSWCWAAFCDHSSCLPPPCQALLLRSC